MRLRAATAILTALLLSQSAGLILPLALSQEQAPQQPSQSPGQEPSAGAPPQAAPQTEPPAETPATPETQPQPAPQEPVQPETPAPKPATPTLHHKRKSSGKRAHKPGKPATSKPATSKPTTDPEKVVVQNGGAKEGSTQLAPGISHEQEEHQRAKTDGLLAATDANLKRVTGRQLTPADESMVAQIRTYMRQAKSAADAGDVNRAHTLAYKAQLLSDELAQKK